MVDPEYLGVVELFPVVWGSQLESIVVRMLDDTGRELWRDYCHRRRNQTVLGLLMETVDLVRHHWGDGVR